MGDATDKRRLAGVRTSRWEEASFLFAVPLALIATVLIAAGLLAPSLSPANGEPAPRAVAASALAAPDTSAPRAIELLPDGTAAPTPDAQPTFTRPDALPEVQHVAAIPATGAATATPAAPVPASTTVAAAGSSRITAVGDSVMLGAAVELKQQMPTAEVDAAVNRQVFAAVDILKKLRDANKLGEVVILHIGNNGDFSAEQFDQVMAILGTSRRVLFLTLKEPRDWEEPNNAVIAAGVARYPNAALVDWRAMSMEHKEYFGADEIHLTPEGAQAYAALVRAHLYPVKAEAK